MIALKHTHWKKKTPYCRHSDEWSWSALSDKYMKWQEHIYLWVEFTPLGIHTESRWHSWTFVKLIYDFLFNSDRTSCTLQIGVCQHNIFFFLKLGKFLSGTTLWLIFLNYLHKNDEWKLVYFLWKHTPYISKERKVLKKGQYICNFYYIVKLHSWGNLRMDHNRKLRPLCKFKLEFIWIQV